MTQYLFDAISEILRNIITNLYNSNIKSKICQIYNTNGIERDKRLFDLEIEQAFRVLIRRKSPLHRLKILKTRLFAFHSPLHIESFCSWNGLKINLQISYFQHIEIVILTWNPCLTQSQDVRSWKD